MKRFLIALSVIASIAHAQPVATLASGASGKFEFMSITPENRFVYGRVPNFQHKQQAVDGDLMMPKNVSGKVPAVVIMHGSRGVNKPLYEVWAKSLNENGIAAFIIYTLKSRGIDNTSTDPHQIDSSVFVADTYNALKLLATHPQIDASKISLIGFSRGGLSAFEANWDSMRKPVIKDDLKFASIVAVYPSGACTYRIRNDRGNTNSNPMLMMFGDKDVTTGGMDKCAPYIDELNAKSNANITWIEYKGGYHGWDGTSPYHFNNGYVSNGECSIDIDYLVAKQGLGAARDFKTGETFKDFAELATHRKKCESNKGHAYEGNSKLRDQSVSDALAFFKKSWSK